MYSIFDIERDTALTFGISMLMDAGVVLYKTVSLTPWKRKQHTDDTQRTKTKAGAEQSLFKNKTNQSRDWKLQG